MPEHHLRADAQRNRTAILDAAEAELGLHGPEVPIDEIARRAGVGVGTVYRHFPTKEALVEAVVTAHIEPLVAAARAAATSAHPGEAFFGLLRHLASEFASFKAVADAIAASGIDLHRTKSAASDELMAAVAVVLDRAKAAGEVRSDISAQEVAMTMGALCMSDLVAREPASLSRCVGLVCDGLRPPRVAAAG